MGENRVVFELSEKERSMSSEGKGRGSWAHQGLAGERSGKEAGSITRVLRPTTCFVQKLGHQYDPERGFRYTDASTAWDEWPGVRMLVWAVSAVARQDHIDLRVFVPRYRAVQRWLEELMSMRNGNFAKFWVRKDW
jgi:hypothetical protein